MNAWAETVLEFPGTGLSIDLRGSLDDGARAALGRSGLPGPFAVITACNPRGVVLPADANRRLDARFSAWVESSHLGAIRVTGRSPDGRHAEPGWALAVAPEEARALAADWQQQAIYWFDGARFWIEPVLSGGLPVPLPAAPVTP